MILVQNFVNLYFLDFGEIGNMFSLEGSLQYILFTYFFHKAQETCAAHTGE